jgi:hypothetical protein
MAADLVSRKVAVISAGAPDVAVRAAMAATKTIPIVTPTRALRLFFSNRANAWAACESPENDGWEGMLCHQS